MGTVGEDRGLARGTAVNAAGALVGKVLELTAFAVALKRVGAGSFGVVVLAQSVSQWPFLLESGVGQTVVRILAAERREAGDDELLGTAVSIYLGLAMAGLAAGLAFSHLLLVPILDPPAVTRSEAILAFDIFVLAGAVRLATGFVPRALLGGTRLAALRLVALVRSVATLGMVLLIVGRGPGQVAGVAVAYLIGEVVAAVVGVALVRPGRIGLRLLRFSQPAASEHWRRSRPVLAANGMGLAASRIDPIIVAVALGAVATTTYGVVLRAYELLQSAMELVFLGLMPATARASAAGDPARVARLFRQSTTCAALLTWPAAAALALLGPEVLRAVVGHDPPGGAAALAAAMVLIVVVTVPTGAFYVLTGTGRVGDVVRVQALALPLNVAVSVSLVRPFGVAVVFVGSAMAEIVTMPRYVRVLRELSQASPRELLGGLARPAVLAAAFALALAGIQLAALTDVITLVAGAACAAVYAVAALMWVVRVEFVGFTRRLPRSR